MSTEVLMVNQDLLKQRMMRGALRGHVTEEENTVGRYCLGKLDNGRPCRIVVVGKGEYCKRHQKEIDALAAGAPIEPGQIERSVSPEEQPKMSTGGGQRRNPCRPRRARSSPAVQAAQACPRRRSPAVHVHPSRFQPGRVCCHPIGKGDASGPQTVGPLADRWRAVQDSLGHQRPGISVR